MNISWSFPLKINFTRYGEALYAFSNLKTGLSHRRRLAHAYAEGKRSDVPANYSSAAFELQNEAWPARIDFIEPEKTGLPIKASRFWLLCFGHSPAAGSTSAGLPRRTLYLRSPQ